MITVFRKSFARDLKKIKDQTTLDRVKAVIEEVERVDSVQEISNLKKMSGADGFFRIRVGDYRIGLIINAETVEFIRFLNRKDLYRYFP